MTGVHLSEKADNRLDSAWLYNSKDVVVGTGRKAKQ
ncbi:hypothetical protein Zm00014a_010672 [Zea mays]|uniref:Uncharacterized protein n=1 Tax=Zea mays TaxID=4577 RepID=A0A3L6EQA1_MAIZE|nr:hypothetical protein Zm00014a_010672 [Zea mays]